MKDRLMPSRQRRLFSLLMITGLLTACATNPDATKASGAVAGVGEDIAKVSTKLIGAPVIPDTTIQIGPSVAYPLEKLVYWGVWIGAAYLIIDPFAPNWEIQEARFPENHLHLSLAMKRYYSGGAGEARQLFHRRAKELMRAGGYAGYEVVEYSEGMESSVLGAKRTAEGVVKFAKKTG